jgi:predicted DsbA family dithiol-disulfide isomerase
MEKIAVQHFSDVLCVWAYVGQVRVDELCRKHGAELAMDYHFVDVFGDVPGRITERWRERGGLAAYGKHVQDVASRFEHAQVHPQVWTRNVPTSSLSSHLFLHAVQEAGGVRAIERAAWALRESFFLHALDISARELQLGVAEELGLSRSEIEKHLDSGLAAARLSRDLRIAGEQGIKVSPTLTFDEGRQVLRGNVGYRVIEANVQELLERGGTQHSWC